MNIRINKLLSDLGLGSRREVEQLVLDGRVAINGRPARLVDQVEEEDLVTLDDEELPLEDIMREYAAEQKMHIAQELAKISLPNDYLNEDYYDLVKTKRKQMNKRGVSYRGNKPIRKGGGGKLSKFKMFEDEEEPFSCGQKSYKKKDSRKNHRSGRRPQSDIHLEEYESLSNFPLAERKSSSQLVRERTEGGKRKTNFSPSGKRNNNPRKPYLEKKNHSQKRRVEHRRPPYAHDEDES